MPNFASILPGYTNQDQEHIANVRAKARSARAAAAGWGVRLTGVGVRVVCMPQAFRAGNWVSLSRMPHNLR